MPQLDKVKIVSLLPSATEIVCALGLADRLAGITHECDHPEEIADRPALTASLISHGSMSSREIDHAVRSSLSGHGSIYELDEDLLSEIDPSLIITQELCDVCAVSYDEVTKAARKYTAGATVVSLEPNTIEDILSNIQTVSDLASVPEQGRRVTRSLGLRLDALKETTQGLADKPRVMMLEWLDPPFAPGHWVPEQVEIAGGIPALGTAGKKSVTTTFEEIAESNADVLVLIPCGYNTEDILRQVPKTRFPKVFSALPAFRKGEVWALDASAYFSRPGPRVVDGAEILAKILHPRTFGAPEQDEAVKVDRALFNFSTDDIESE